MPVTRESIKKYLRSEYPHVSISNQTLISSFVPVNNTRFLFGKFIENLQNGLQCTIDPLLQDALHQTKFQTLGQILPFLLCMVYKWPVESTRKAPVTASAETWKYTPQHRWPFPTGLKD